jgi:hypothetical protein
MAVVYGCPERLPFMNVIVISNPTAENYSCRLLKTFAANAGFKIFLMSYLRGKIRLG